MLARVWQQRPCPEEAVDRLADALRLPRTAARLLAVRGIVDPEAGERFLAPSLAHLHDPMRLADMGAAVARLEAALARGETIAVHGDYDVDGITSTVMLRRLLELLGGRVVHVIPERLREGYGLQPATVERLHAEGVRLLVSVDCGIRSVEAASRARQLGLDLVITDHHEPGDALPPAVAVVNPRRRDCAYPDKDLAGAGVVFKLVQALCRRYGRERWLPAFVKVAALGTLADVVPLVGENRVLARVGLDELSSGRHTVGIRALLEASRLAGRPIDSYHVAFVLAPRLNAAGRMSTPDLAARLLLLADEAMAEEARQLAEALNGENERRQREEQAIVAEARARIETDPEIGARDVLVVAGEGWHRGVIGIVASKLVETFHRPAVVLSIEGEMAHGSCRSIPAFDMLAALERAADLLDRFGGHRQAAGLQLPAARIGELRARLQAHAETVLTPDDLRPRLWLDAPLRFADITPPLVEALERLAPFGMGNPRPVFDARAVEIVAGPSRLKERHVAMTVRQDGRLFRAIAWRGADRLDLLDAHRAALDLAYSVERNTWGGASTLELQVADARPPGV